MIIALVDFIKTLLLMVVCLILISIIFIFFDIIYKNILNSIAFREFYKKSINELKAKSTKEIIEQLRDYNKENDNIKK